MQKPRVNLKQRKTSQLKSFEGGLGETFAKVSAQPPEASCHFFTHQKSPHTNGVRASLFQTKK
jgi:hypothetical protein